MSHIHTVFRMLDPSRAVGAMTEAEFSDDGEAITGTRYGHSRRAGVYAELLF
jgi:hypothetical protein